MFDFCFVFFSFSVVMCVLKMMKLVLMFELSVMILDNLEDLIVCCGVYIVCWLCDVMWFDDVWLYVSLCVLVYCVDVMML